MKNRALAIFKYPRPWNIDVVNRFSNYYDTEYLYISNYINKNFTEIINEINDLIKSKNIEIIIFDVDYFKFMNFFFIDKINGKKKILVTGDDTDQHEMHSVTAGACDLVLSHDPLSVLKFKEKGYEAHMINFEISNLKSIKNQKEIDVLFFGHLTTDRKKFLDYISKEGISVKNVGHYEHVEGLPKDQLINLISKSKIVLNLSKTRTTSVKRHSSESIYRYYYQFKGRIYLTGLIGTACVSEYSPGQEIIFKEDELPTFFTKEECVKILKKLLTNNELLEKYTNKFTARVHELWDDKKNFEPIYKAIEKTEHRRVKLIRFPYWYMRIAAKQIILRNLKLFTLVKSMFQFNIVFSIIRNSNLLIKFLIIFESIINIFWYGLISTLKFKKLHEKK
jgi:hypothetical protein|tara:strand:+ start:70 stop:1248 length:1179 start_codon:yes stop_codon:yes gene_type:complete